MNVGLTHTHYRTLLNITAGSPLYKVFQRDVTPTTTTGITVVAPYIAWERTMNLLNERYWTNRPRHERDVPHHVRVMMRRIATAQNAIVRHPALSNVAMLGTHVGWFPVWTDVQGIRSPMPGHGTFSVIGAQTVEGQRKTALTVWTEHGWWPTEHWLAQEETHTALL